MTGQKLDNNIDNLSERNISPPTGVGGAVMNPLSVGPDFTLKASTLFFKILALESQ
jgi:hypothetical protein